MTFKIPFLKRCCTYMWPRLVYLLGTLKKAEMRLIVTKTDKKRRQAGAELEG